MGVFHLTKKMEGCAPRVRWAGAETNCVTRSSSSRFLQLANFFRHLNGGGLYVA